MASKGPKKLHLIGVGVGHSIAPVMHNYICKSLNKPWNFYATEASTIEEAIGLLKEAEFAGAVITMPYKKSVMLHLDGIDEVASTIGACNNVYLSTDGKLQGSNTDWRGVYGCLRAASKEGKGKPAMIIGAGGASRAAIYALVQLQCPLIYVVNRDEQEVQDLMQDTYNILHEPSNYSSNGEAFASKIVHLQNMDEARESQAPCYIVSTVPDLVPETAMEKTAIRIFDHFLSTASVSGVFLDMCFKPRVTRKIKLAKARGWETVEGTEIIGHQIGEQYRLWTEPALQGSQPVIGDDLKTKAWEVLRQQAAEHPGINFEVDELEVS